jgi:hypothetical protein
VKAKAKKKPKGKVILVFESANGKQYEAELLLGEKRVVEITPEMLKEMKRAKP